MSSESIESEDFRVEFRTGGLSVYKKTPVLVAHVVKTGRGTVSREVPYRELFQCDEPTILDADLQEDGSWEVDRYAGVKRWMGNLREMTVESILHGLGFTLPQIQEIIDRVKNRVKKEIE